MIKIKEWYKLLPIQLKASVWFLVCSFFQRGMALITTPIFTRLMSTDEYGNFNVFNSWMSIISIIVTLNLFGGVYQRGLVKYESERGVFISSIQGLTFVLCSVWTVIYFVFRTFWNSLFSLTTVQMLAMLVLIWTNVVFNLWAGEQRVELKYRTLVIVTLVITIVQPLISILFVVYADDKVTARILGLVVAQLVGYSWMFFVHLLKGKKPFSSKFWKHALLFNIPLLPHYISQTILNSSDRIMIQRMVDDSSAGIYSLAYALAQIMILFNVALADVLTPWIYTKIRDNKAKEISRIAYATLMIVALVNVLLIAFAPEAVKLFAPPEYYDAIWCIPPIAMSVFFLYCYDLFAKFEFYYEKTRLIAVATFIGAAVNIISNYFFIKIFGYIAAAYTTLFCYILYALFHFFAMKYVCNKYLYGECPYKTKILLIISSIFIGIGVTYLVTYTNTVVRYIFTIVLFVFVFIFRKRIVKAVKEVISIKKISRE